MKAGDLAMLLARNPEAIVWVCTDEGSEPAASATFHAPTETVTIYGTSIDD